MTEGTEETAVTVRERPILFSAEMVRAILDGRKTQTRRVVKGVALDWLSHFTPEYVALPENGLSPYGQSGDRLWVREAWGTGGYFKWPIAYRADGVEYPNEKWRPSIHMPRAASRITLEITDVRVQRVQEIGEDDAVAEGVEPVVVMGTYRTYTNYAAGLPAHVFARDSFRSLWDKLNVPRGYGWDANPWVWAITFKRVEVQS